MHYYYYNEKKKHGTEDFPVDYYFVDRTHHSYNMPFHWHKEWELIHILEGELLLSVDGKEYKASAGDVLLLREGMLHGGAPDNCVYECLDFYLHGLFINALSIKKYLALFYRHVYLPTVYFPASSEVCNIVEELFSSFRTNKGEDLCRLTTISGIIRLFCTILEKGYYIENTQDDTRSTGKIEKLKPVFEYIESNFSSNVTLEQLSKIIGMNPGYFCRYFHSITQQTPINYLTQFRIECAAMMLSSTDKSITEIGFDCGFNDICHFIKTFKKFKGMTPKKYQKSNSI